MTDGIEARLAAIEARQRAQGEVLAAMEALTTTVHGLADTVADLQLAVDLGDKPEKIVPWRNVWWHELADDSEELKAELHRLRGWLTEIAVPVLGWEGLPPCVLSHKLAVVAIDVAVELHRVLWLTEGRNHAMVAQQADYLLRVMPGLQAVVKQACAGCEHQMDPHLRQFTRRQEVK